MGPGAAPERPRARRDPDPDPDPGPDPGDLPGPQVTAPGTREAAGEGGARDPGMLRGGRAELSRRPRPRSRRCRIRDSKGKGAIPSFYPGKKQRLLPPLPPPPLRFPA